LKIRVLFLFCVFNHFLYCQDDEEIVYKQIEPKHSYTITFGVPISIANKPFKSMMQGLLMFSSSYQFALKNHLYFGLGGNYTYFNVNRFKITPQINGGLHIPTVYFKFGYEKFQSERVGFDFGVKMGASQVIYHSDSLDNYLKFNSILLEPYFSFSLTADYRSAFKWTLAYSFLQLGFTPQKMGIYQNLNYPASEFSRMTRYISVGFSYTHYFKQRE